MDFELIKNILILLGELIALLTFLLSYLEYQKQGKQKRVDLHLEMERRLFNNDNFQKIRLLLQKGKSEITKIERKIRSDYAGFFDYPGATALRTGDFFFFSHGPEFYSLHTSKLLSNPSRQQELFMRTTSGEK